MLHHYLPKFLKKALQGEPVTAIAEPASLPAEAVQSAADRPESESALAEQIIPKIRPYSMVPHLGLEFLVQAVQSVLEQQVPGDFVECGVWKGGCAAAMKLTEHLLQPQSQRLLHLFDSFEGLPPVQPIDGPLARRWQEDVDSPGYFDNCTASLGLVQQNFNQLGILDLTVKFYKGWFETTVPQFVQQNPETKIAILRLDGDWYESTKVCLENLYPLVSENGIIIIDDYYYWDGCAFAVHEYLGKNGLNHRIRSIADFSSAYIIKQAYREA